MKITYQSLNAEAEELRDEDVDAHQLKTLLLVGHCIRLVNPSSEAFNVLAVQIPLAGVSPEFFLNHEFTRNHAAVSLLLRIANDRQSLVLIFSLASALPKKQFGMAQLGLAITYATASSTKSPVEYLTAGDGSSVEAYPNVLNQGAVDRLIDLGTEERGRSGSEEDKTYLRSSIQLPLTTLVQIPHGNAVTVNEANAGQLVACPVHVGVNATAQVVELEKRVKAVVCHTCCRTFACAAPHSRYDFDVFDRVVQELAHEEIEDKQRQFKVLADRFLPPGVIDSPGIWIVKSPKGSGKTELLKRVVEAAKKDGERVLVVGHRTSLLQAQGERLGLVCYKESLLDEADEFLSDAKEPSEKKASGSKSSAVRSNSPHPYYAICLDSLGKLQPMNDKYAVVLIDESEQVLRHMCGRTLRENRRHVYKLLEHYLAQARQVIFLDADLGMVTMSTVFNIKAKPEVPRRIVLNQPVPAKGEIWMYESDGELATVMLNAVARDEKVYVATNSKRKAIELQILLAKLHPIKRIVAVHSDNSQHAEIQRMTKNLAFEFENGLDVLIASPSLGTGIDISFRDATGAPKTVVKSVFGFFQKNINTHFDIDQQLWRVREPGSIHVYVDPTPYQYETDPAAIRAELRHTVGCDFALVGYDAEGRMILNDDQEMLELWAQVESQQRASKNRLSTSFKQLRMAAGFSIQMVKSDEEAKDSGKEALGMARQQRIEQRAERIVSADDIERGQFLQWKRWQENGMELTAEQLGAVEKYELRSFYVADEVDDQLIEFDKDGQTRSAIRNLEPVLWSKSEVERKALELMHSDAYQQSESYRARVDDPTAAAGRIPYFVPEFDRHMLPIRRQILTELLEQAGLYDCFNEKVTPESLITQESLAGFIAKLKEYSAQMQRLFRLAPRADCDQQRVRQLGQVLKLMGLWLDKPVARDSGGKKVREYVLDVARLDVLREVVERRLARSKERAQKKGEDGERSASGKEGQEKLRAAIAKLRGQPPKAVGVEAAGDPASGARKRADDNISSFVL